MTARCLGEFGTAVVIGGSIAGASVAAALSPHFDEVVVLDRDEFPADPAPRKGVPHGYQFHTLTVGGRQALEELFPGLTEELKAAGVPYSDPSFHTRYASKFGWFPRQHSSMRTLQATRRYLEWYVRERSRKLGNVTFRENAKVTGLEVNKGWVTGVRTVQEQADHSAAISADLVVDASGRSSQAPKWLDEVGYPKPEETVVNARWGYATTYVRVPEDWDPGYRSLYVGPTVSGDGPGATRGAALWPQEGNLVVVTAQGCAGDYPPRGLDAFRSFLRSIDAPEFDDLIERFGTVADVEVWRNTANRLRDYASLPICLEGFVVVGDAAAAFNPIYGQGMAVAAMGSRLLGNVLGKHKTTAADLKGFAASAQQDLHDLEMRCWQFSTSSDFKVPGVQVNGVGHEQQRHPESDYADRVLALACEDPTVALKFQETVNLIRDLEWMADEELRQRVLADWDRLGTFSRSTA